VLPEMAVLAGFLQAGGCTITAMNPLSGVLDEAWRMYRAHAAHLLTIAFVIYLVAAVIAALLALIGGFFGVLLGSIVAFLLQAALVKAVQDVRDGRADLSFGETVSAAVPYIGPVAGASILAGIAITIGLVLIIVPGLFLITIWAVIVPVIVIERSGALASFGRSRELVRGAAAAAAQRAEHGDFGNPHRPVHRPCRDADLLPAVRRYRRSGTGERHARGRVRSGLGQGWSARVGALWSGQALSC
jgi:hypothetical protein